MPTHRRCPYTGGGGTGRKFAPLRDRKQLSTNPLVYTNIHNFEITIHTLINEILKKRSQKDFIQIDDIYNDPY